MNRLTITNIFTALLIVVVIILFLRVSSMWKETAAENEALKKKLVQVRDSLNVLHNDIDTLRMQTPGLGEYMTTIQLHAAKLKFAATNSNWGLADYELGELGETIEAAEALHAIKNNVNITDVLSSLHETQLPLVKQSIDQKNIKAFESAYTQTLATCNGCHKSAGYGFIHIIPPTHEPVANQEWKIQ